MQLNIHVGRNTRSVRPTLGNGGWSQNRTAASHRAITQSAFTKLQQRGTALPYLQMKCGMPSARHNHFIRRKCKTSTHVVKYQQLRQL